TIRAAVSRGRRARFVTLTPRGARGFIFGSEQSRRGSAAVRRRYEHPPRPLPLSRPILERSLMRYLLAAAFALVVFVPASHSSASASRAQTYSCASIERLGLEKQ